MKLRIRSAWEKIAEGIYEVDMPSIEVLYEEEDAGIALRVRTVAVDTNMRRLFDDKKNFYKMAREEVCPRYPTMYNRGNWHIKKEMDEEVLKMARFKCLQEELQIQKVVAKQDKLIMLTYQWDNVHNWEHCYAGNEFDLKRVDFLRWTFLQGELEDNGCHCNTDEPEGSHYGYCPRNWYYNSCYDVDYRKK